ncbi:MAG: DUF4339 domain-containing protein [Chitinophagaceae bacterium]|nr:MAG: DUF4339 domain-containing protein [Chitinophagaceae bacterium]
MNTYYLHDGRQQTGPFTVSELKDHGIKNDTHVWAEGMDGWRKAGDIDELKFLFVVVPPPFPGAAPVPPPFEAAEPGAPFHDEELADQPVRTRRKRRLGLVFFISGIVLALAVFAIYQNAQKNAEEADKLSMRIMWDRHLSARHSDYKYSNWGGIYGLKVIFTNDSKYMMNEMTATVSYIKANGDIWRNVPVTIYNVAPYTTITQSMEDVERGTSVEVQLTGAVSREAEFNMVKGYDSGNPGDRYHMR